MRDLAEITEAGPGDHLVFFYDSDQECASTVGTYLRAALTDHGTAVAAATRPHLDAIAGCLAGAGVDVAAARASGRYVEWDAETTLTRLRVGDGVDAAAFWALAAPVLRAATGRSGPVVVFGEIVTVLWRGGTPAAVIELEAMWDELAAQFPFAMLCAYPASQVSAAADSDHLTQVCRAHTAVSGPVPAATGG